MTLRDRMIADRRLRDSARALLAADIEFMKGDLARKGLSERAGDRIRQGALDVYDEAFEVAADNKGALAALIAAVLLWFARHPILETLGLRDAEGEEQAEAAER